MTRVAVVEGDGIGHEVIPIARDVLALLHPEFDFFPVDVGYSLSLIHISEPTRPY